MYICTSICTHIYMHIYVCIHVYTYTYIYILRSIYIYIYIYICICIYVHLYVPIYICIYMYVYMYIYIHIHIFFIYTYINTNIIRIYEGRVGFCSKRTCTFSGIQFTRHFIEFVVLETNQMVGSNSNVIFTRHTCGHRSGMNAGGKRRALAFYLSVRICYMFRMAKCRGESYLGLCRTSGLAKRMPLRSTDFQFLNVFGRKIRQNSALRSGIPFGSPEVMHRPRSHSPLWVDKGNI